MACPVKPSIDLSDIKFPGEMKRMPEWELAAKITVVVILEIMAVSGNVLVILIVLQSKKMRTTTNLYLLNLAIADLFMASIPMWVVVVEDAADGWILGAFMCKFNACFQGWWLLLL